MGMLTLELTAINFARSYALIVIRRAQENALNAKWRLAVLGVKVRITMLQMFLRFINGALRFVKCIKRESVRIIIIGTDSLRNLALKHKILQEKVQTILFADYVKVPCFFIR